MSVNVEGIIELLGERGLTILAAKLGTPTDWHYSGGRAQVLTLHEDLAEATEVARTLWESDTPLTVEREEPMLVLGWGVEGHALYRNRG